MVSSAAAEAAGVIRAFAVGSAALAADAAPVVRALAAGASGAELPAVGMPGAEPPAVGGLLAVLPVPGARASAAELAPAKLRQLFGVRSDRP